MQPTDLSKCITYAEWKALNGITEENIYMEPKLNLGDTVYYQRYGSPGGEHKAEPSPAIVTQIFEDGTTCQLFVMNPNGTYFNIICGRFIQLEYGCPGAHS